MSECDEKGDCRERRLTVLVDAIRDRELVRNQTQRSTAMVREWRDVLRGMRDALRPGGTLLLTCDSGDVARPWRARLRGVPRGPRLEELGVAARELGLEVQALRRYGRRDLKARQGELDGAGRLETLRTEESLEPDDPREWRLLYLRAGRPAAPPRPGESGQPG